MEFRAYHNKPPLGEFCGLVIVTPELHNEFYLFKEKEKEIRCGESIFPLNTLLHHWNRQRAVPSPTITMYGKLYLKLDTSEADDLCQWVYETREKSLKLTDVETGPTNCVNGKYCIKYH